MLPSLPPSSTAGLAMFAPSDLATITTWLSARPHGLRGDITADHDHFGDMLEVFRGDPNRPLYFITPPRPFGSLEVFSSDLRQGAFRAATGKAGFAEVTDITAALALVRGVELLAMGA